jgi:hypothetical protein
VRLFKARINESAGTVAYELRYEGLQGDIRQAHIHFGQRNVNGSISVYLCQTATDVDPTVLAPVCGPAPTGTLNSANVIGTAAQGIAATEFAELVKAIRAGVVYVNVHSSVFPAGVVRGQAQFRSPRSRRRLCRECASSRQAKRALCRTTVRTTIKPAGLALGGFAIQSRCRSENRFRY